jgi:hypothetical protein
MGHRRGGKLGEYTLNKALPILVDAIKS